MGYLIKSDVVAALRNDKENTLLYYDFLSLENKRAAIEFCYRSIDKAVDELPQYRLDNVYTSNEIIIDYEKFKSVLLEYLSDSLVQELIECMNDNDVFIRGGEN